MYTKPDNQIKPVLIVRSKAFVASSNSHNIFLDWTDNNAEKQILEKNGGD